MNQVVKKNTLTLSPAPSPTKDTVQRCIAKLEAALAIRISHTDSDSRVEQLNAQRSQAMREVVADLKSLG